MRYDPSRFAYTSLGKWLTLHRFTGVVEVRAPWTEGLIAGPRNRAQGLWSRQPKVSAVAVKKCGSGNRSVDTRDRIALFERQEKQMDVNASEAGSIASDAWVFGMPLIYIDKQIDVQTHVSKPDGPLAPINQFSQYRTFPDASNRVIVGLNVDTLYSLAALDLSQGPIVLSVPEMGNASGSCS